MPSDIFTVTNTPCGVPVYEIDFSDWRAAGFPHPVTGESLQSQVMLRSAIVREDDPSNRYGIAYVVMEMSDKTLLRVLYD